MDSKIFDFGDVSHPDSLATIKETLLAARAEDSSIKIEKCSPVAPVTLKGEPLKKAKIPDDATSFCYTYPLIEHRVDNLGCPLVSLFTIGSFVYFDNMLNVVGINALSFEEPKGTKADLGAQVIYGEGQALKGKESKDQVLRHLEGSDGGIRRWQEATAKPIRDLGYTQYAWIAPSEVIPALHQNENELQCPKYGGFAYKRDDSGSGEVDLLPIVGAKAGEDAENLMLQPYDLYGQLLKRLEDWPNHPLAPKQAPPPSPIEDLIKMLKHRAHSKPPRLIFDKSLLPTTRQVFGSSLPNSEVACLHEPKPIPMCTYFPAYHLDDHAPICRLAGRQGGEKEGKSRLCARHDGPAEGAQIVERGESQTQLKRESPC